MSSFFFFPPFSFDFTDSESNRPNQAYDGRPALGKFVFIWKILRTRQTEFGRFNSPARRFWRGASAVKSINGSIQFSGFRIKFFFFFYFPSARQIIRRRRGAMVRRDSGRQRFRTTAVFGIFAVTPVAVTVFLHDNPPSDTSRRRHNSRLSADRPSIIVP